MKGRILSVALAAAILSSVWGTVTGMQFQEVTGQLGPFGSGESWGASWGDINEDGWPDLFLSNHRLRAALYRNEGAAGFRDVTLEVDRSGTWILTPWNDQHGGTFGDYDNNGTEDLFIATGSQFDEQLFENVGGSLVDRTAWAAINGIGVGDGRHALWVDINNDGLLDLISVNFSDNLLWERARSGDTGFVRSNKDYGFNRRCLYGNLTAQLLDVVGDSRLELLCVNDSSFTSGLFDIAAQPFTDLKALIPISNLVNDVALGDFDGDLRNDLFVLQGVLRPNQALQVAANKVEARLGIGSETPEKGFKFKSDGGVLTLEVHTIHFGAAHFFIGADGWHPNKLQKVVLTLDPADPATWGQMPHDPLKTTRGIYVGYDPATGDWEFRMAVDDISRQAYFAIASSMPVSDVRNSGLTGADLPRTPRLLRNTGSDGFVDMTPASGLNVPLFCSSTVAADFDNDMDLDIYLVCRGGAENLPNRLFMNQGDGTFVEVIQHGAEGPIGFNIQDGAGTGDSAAVADFDIDGKLDLAVTNGLNMYPVDYGGPNQLFRNRASNDNRWLLLDLVGTQSNRDGVGAKVVATSGGRSQLREQNGGTHRWSQNHQRLHFGLGSNELFDLRIEWPSGHVDEYLDLTANGLYEAVEASGIALVEVDPPQGSAAPSGGDECGAPVYDVALDPAVFVWRNCDTSEWHMRVVGGGQSATTQYRGRVSSDQPFASYGVISLEGLDKAELSNSNAIDFDLYISYSGEDGFNFRMQPGARTCLGLDAPSPARVYLGARRVPVDTPFDLDTLGSCNTLPALSIEDVTVGEAEGFATFWVSLSAVNSRPVTVGYSSHDGGALAGSDYTSVTGTLTFVPGETRKRVDVPILDDGLAETTEAFRLVLGDASGATIERGSAVAMIVDDDTPVSCGTPSIAAKSQAGVFLWQDCASGQWSLRVTGGGSPTVLSYRGEIVSGHAFTGAAGVLLEPSDVVALEDARHLGFKLNVQGGGVDGVEFAFASSPDVCFKLTSPANARIYLGAGKVEYAAPFDLTTLGPCAIPAALSVGDVTVGESDGVASFLVSLSKPTSEPVTVSFATLDGSAIQDIDYVAASGILSFGPGETAKAVDIVLIDDTSEEPVKTFRLALAQAVGAEIAQGTGTATLIDDDHPLPELSVGDLTVNEVDRVAGFPLTLSSPAKAPVTVLVGTQDGSALAGTDYLPLSTEEEIVFQPGEALKTVYVEIIDDDLPEPHETFHLLLSEPSGATIARPQGTTTIIDDDAKALWPGLSIGDVTVNEDDGAARFSVTLSAASADVITVSYASADASAAAGVDYVAVAGTLQFAPGETAMMVDVDVIDDAEVEPTEHFTLELSGATAANLLKAVGTGTILDDDAMVSPACGMPAYSSANETGVFLWHECADPQQWRVRFTAGGQSVSYRGAVSSTGQFASLVGVSQEGSDVLSPAPFATPSSGPIDFVQNVGQNGFDGFDLRIPSNAEVCFALTTPTNRPVRMGADRVLVTMPISLRTFSPCTP
jgi:hypothetical protein